MDPKYDEYKNIIERNLLDYLPDKDGKNDLLIESMEYSLTAGGKRLRPVLLLAACDIAKGDIEDAIPFAIAVEYIHTYSLIHDDLPAMDDDNYRRGKLTNHKVYGDAMAILAGDALLNRAFEIMTDKIKKSVENGYTLEKISGLINAMDDIGVGSGSGGMIGGQVADIAATGVDTDKDDIDEAFLEYIHSNKTAALIEAAILAGLHIANSPEEMTDIMRDFGHYLGLGFQMRDDILDIEGDQEVLGKDIGSDQKEEKTTYISIVGIEGAKKYLDDYTDKALETLDKLSSHDVDVRFFKKLTMDMTTRMA